MNSELQIAAVSDTTLTIWRLVFVAVLVPLAGWLIYRAMGCLLVTGRQRWKKILLVAVFGFASMMIIYLGDWANILPTFLVFLGIVYLGYEGSVLKRLALGLMFSSILFAVSTIVDNWIKTHGMMEFAILSTGLRILFWFLLWQGIRRLSIRREFELSVPMWSLLLLLTATPLGVVFNTVLLAKDSFRSDKSLQSLIFCILALSAFLGLLWMVLVLERQQRLEEERILYEMNQKYYDALAQQNEEVRRLRHDMNNHLQTALALTGERQREYLQGLLENPQLGRRLKYCGDETVNAVLSSKAAVLEQKEAAFDVKADIPGEISMEKQDICALFGNALDNALEAVQRLPVPERKITLESRLGKGMLVLRVKNSCEPVSWEAGADGLPATTKRERAEHGLGLRSIRKVAEKYSGSMEIRRENGAFELFVYCRCEEHSGR